MNLSNRIFYQADRQLKDVTLTMLKQKTGCGTFLDLGCGDCQFTREVEREVQPHKVITVDSIDVRNQYSQSYDWYTIKADLNHALPLQSNSVDLIHAGDVIEHLNDTDTFVKEIKRILKPDGFAVISTPNLASWHNIALLALGRQPPTCMVSDEIIKPEMVEADKDMPKHRRIFTADGLTALCKYHGLKILEVQGAGYYPCNWQILSKIDRVHAAYVVLKVGK